MHRRNRHTGRYDFPALISAQPELGPHVAPNAYGDLSIDFANPAAVKELNRALLRLWYGLGYWNIPEGYLCPAIPGRADYVHHAADLLAEENGGEPPTGAGVRAVDIGTGANCVYPIVGHGEYGWSFVGTDVDTVALDSARLIAVCNPQLCEPLSFRPQKTREHILRGVIGDDERFDILFCNPPFHASAEEAADGSRRKWRNLGVGGARRKAPVLNFGGSATELWCPGGETAFVSRLATESREFAGNVRRFTALVSKSENLPAILAAVRRAGPKDCRVVEMAQGAKRSRFVTWSFGS